MYLALCKWRTACKTFRPPSAISTRLPCSRNIFAKGKTLTVKKFAIITILQPNYNRYTNFFYTNVLYTTFTSCLKVRTLTFPFPQISTFAESNIESRAAKVTPTNYHQ
jgi:hypothetical protein